MKRVKCFVVIAIFFLVLGAPDLVQGQASLTPDNVVDPVRLARVDSVLERYRRHSHPLFNQPWCHRNKSDYGLLPRGRTLYVSICEIRVDQCRSNSSVVVQAFIPEVYENFRGFTALFNSYSISGRRFLAALSDS